MQGKYELLYIVHPDLESSIDKITDRIRGFVEKREGKVTYEENWGKRKLAYEIKKSEVGIYLLWYFEAPKDSIVKIERDIRLTEEVIRYILLATEDKVKETKSKTEPKEPKPEAKEEETPAKKTVRTTAKKAAPKKEAKETIPTESETERMKQLDEKLGAILGEEEDNKEEKAKVKSAKKAVTKKKAEKESK